MNYTFTAIGILWELHPLRIMFVSNQFHITTWVTGYARLGLCPNKQLGPLSMCLFLVNHMPHSLKKILWNWSVTGQNWTHITQVSQVQQRNALACCATNALGQRGNSSQCSHALTCHVSRRPRANLAAVALDGAACPEWSMRKMAGPCTRLIRDLFRQWKQGVSIHCFIANCINVYIHARRILPEFFLLQAIRMLEWALKNISPWTLCIRDVKNVWIITLCIHTAQW